MYENRTIKLEMNDVEELSIKTCFLKSLCLLAILRL